MWYTGVLCDADLFVGERPNQHQNTSKTGKVMRNGQGISVHHVKSQMPSHGTNVVSAAGLHNILMFAPTVL